MTMNQVSLPKVLCVDDEPGLLRSLRWLLRGQYEVAVASSATRSWACRCSFMG